MKRIASALAETKLVFYTGEEKLVSLDVLKLYRGEDVVHQNPEDKDPDQWLVGKATGGTKRGSGGRGQRTTRGPEKTRVIS